MILSLFVFILRILLMSKVITLDGLRDYLTNLKRLFVTKTDAESTYETKTNAANIYETKEDAATHLTKTEASETYITKADAADTYENKTDASNTYATKTEVSDTYLSKADAAEIYKGLVTVGKTYSVIIDFSLSDPGTMITYDNDITISALSTDWFDELGLKLCVLKDGVVQYYLNPSNVALKLDGSAADITTVGNDVMLEVPRMGTFCTWLDDNKLKISITTESNKANFDYRAFSLHQYNDCDKIYIGRYHAYSANSKLYSSSGKTPIVGDTLANYRTYATNRGTGYTDIGICDDILLQCLYLLIVRHFNSQTTIGRGICDTSAKHNTGEANTFGWLNTGSTNKTNGNTAICCLGIENFWGNIWVWEDGIIRNSSRQFFMAQYADQYNSDATGYEYIAQASPTSTGYMGRVAGVPKFIFMPDASTVAASNRGETTYMCDYQWINENITSIAGFGGYWCSGSHVGAFYRTLYNAPSTAGDYVGSRLVFKHIAQ